MAGTLYLRVLTPERTVLEVQDAVKVRLRLADGAWLSVYANHAPLLAEALPGPLQYDTETETGEISLGSSILWVAENRVDVLTSGFQQPDEAERIEGAETFDRLARQLLQELGAQVAEPASGGDEGESG